MSNISPLSEILTQIGNELSNQISHVGNVHEIDVGLLSTQSKTLNKLILTSGISEENKNMLETFSLTLQEGLNVKSLRYEKQDLERILSNLND